MPIVKPEISGHVVDAAMRVHTALGPGLLESAYEACMAVALRNRGLRVERQVASPIVFEGIRIDVGYRLDLLVEQEVVVELKAVTKVLPIHHAQLLSYMRLGRYPVGLLLNFHVRHMRDGIIRLAN
jgi:GxxExxY protein